MSKIKAVLLVPAEGDPHGLLKEGPCGARPPMVEQFRADVGWAEWRICTRSKGSIMDCRAEWGDDYRVALILAWDGEPVAEVQPYIERAGIDYELLAPFVTYALKGMDIGQGPWPGTLVLLDAEGREVNDE